MVMTVVAAAILAALALASQALGGVEQLPALLLVPTSALTVMILILLLGVWRLIALVDAAAAPRDSRRRNAAIAVALAAVVLGGGWVVLCHGGTLPLRMAHLPSADAGTARSDLVAARAHRESNSAGRTMVR